MKRLVAVAVLVACGVSLGMSAALAEDLKPIPAAEAEKRTTEARDALTDRLWMGLDDYWHAGDWDSCIRLCKEIVAIDPQFVEAYTSAAYLEWNRNRDDQAIALYEQGIKANPDSPDIYFEYAFYCRDRKKYEQAVKLMRTAVSKGLDGTKQHLLPNTLAEMGQKQEALDEWRALQKRFPKDPVAPRKINELQQQLAKPKS